MLNCVRIRVLLIYLHMSLRVCIPLQFRRNYICMGWNQIQMNESIVELNVANSKHCSEEQNHLSLYSLKCFLQSCLCRKVIGQTIAGVYVLQMGSILLSWFLFLHFRDYFLIFAIPLSSIGNSCLTTAFVRDRWNKCVQVFALIIMSVRLAACDLTLFDEHMPT